jgi:ABC-2 type transport system permease protein
MRNLYPRSAGGSGAAWASAIGLIWYGSWAAASFLVARVSANPDSAGRLEASFPDILLLMFLYWQVVPLLMAATGAALDIRKLRAYPIPVSQLFGIEVLLRTTAAIEMLTVLVGATVGLALNPRVPVWRASGLIFYALFNLLLAVGLRDLTLRLLAHRRIREVAVFLLVLCAGLPQLLMTRGRRGGFGLSSWILNGESAKETGWALWPWSATAGFLKADHWWASFGIMLGWCAAAGAFGLWQFIQTLDFDAEAAGARVGPPVEKMGLLDRLYRLPAALFGDPLAALMEKEIRFLARSPRFRLVFMMGFTFGLVVWLPVAMGRAGASQTFIGAHYLTAVSVYSLLLLSEVCFWNSFGFDRSAAQFYFLAPIPFSRVLAAKNLSAIFFIALEIALITLVCGLLGMPLDPAKMAEAYSVAVVISIFLLGAGNLLSIHMARGVNPDSSFRTSAAGRVQAMLFLIYPLACIPPALAYLARFAFDTQAAFFGVLAFDVAAGVVAYKISLDSAVAAAERIKEKMLTALALADGPIAS